MPRYVIADASVLMVLDKIEQLELLKDIYQDIYTTPGVAKEFGISLQEWIFSMLPHNANP